MSIVSTPLLNTPHHQVAYNRPRARQQNGRTEPLVAQSHRAVEGDSRILDRKSVATLCAARGVVVLRLSLEAQRCERCRVSNYPNEPARDVTVKYEIAAWV
jgi:hypothetical protein